MQIKDNYLNHKSSVWIYLKIGVAVLALFFVFRKFRSNKIELGAIEWPDNSAMVIGLVFGMMLLNWSLEAARWRYSVSFFEKVSFFESLKSVLGGLALNWVMPFTTGDAIYRLTQMNDKYKTASAILINRVIMLSITMIYGMISIRFYSSPFLDFNISILFVLVLIIPALWIIRNRIKRFLDYFEHIQRMKIFIIVSISLFRYGVFITQFFLLLDLFLPEIANKILLLGIGWIFFFKSAIPSILGGVGVREASGLIFFDGLGNPGLVLVPIFLIWIINSLIPSICGILFFWSGRLESNK